MIKKFMIILSLILILQANAFAIERYEAEPFIGKEAEILLTIRYKNEVRYIPLIVWIEEVLIVNGYDYVAVKGESVIPFLVPCANIKRIRRVYD